MESDCVFRLGFFFVINRISQIKQSSFRLHFFKIEKKNTGKVDDVIKAVIVSL